VSAHGTIKEKNDVRIRLLGKTKEHFFEIRDENGFETNTEVMRFIINDYYRIRLRKGPASGR
jgi:hypothetical protein